MAKAVRLSKNEVAAQKSGQTLKAYKAGKSTPVLSGTQAKKAASSSVSKESKSLASAQKEYLKSLEVSGEEKAATSQLGAINQGVEQEIAKITNTQGAQGNTVASPVIERQSDAARYGAEQKMIPLKYQIAALQSQREARGNIAQAKMGFAKSSSTKAVDPLDTEYKTLRNENLKKNIAKKGKGGGGGSDLKAYNAQKAEDAARGLVSLPKGQAGPPAPKVLIQQNAANAKTLSAAQKKRNSLKSALLNR